MPKRYRMALVLVLAAGAGLAATVLARRVERRRPARDRVAVSVFANRTGDSTLEPLGSMAADWITRGLAQLEDVEAMDVGAVYAQGRSETGDPVDPVALARRNGAGTVVSGSYYLATDTLVVRASLVDAATGTVLQTIPPVHAPAGDAVRALDLLRQHVTASLAGVLDVRFASFTSRPAAPRSYSAYQAFVAGQAAYWQGRPAAEVRALFQRAAEEDSTFITAPVWLAFVGANGAGCALTDSIATALEGRRAALGSFDRLTLDISAARCRNDWDAGFDLAREQAALRPRSTYAVYTAGVFGLHSGHFRQAVALLGSIDPERDLGWLTDSAKMIYWRDYAGALHLTGDYGGELRHAERLVRGFPDRAVARLLVARALAAFGRGNEALTHLEVALRIPADESARIQAGLSAGHIATLLAMELRVHGDTAAARIAAERAVDWFRDVPKGQLAGRYERYFWARCLAMLGRYDEAVAAMAFRAPSESNDLLYLGLEGVLAGYRGAADAAAEADGRLAAMVDPAITALVTAQRARVAMARGERERALELLEWAFDRPLARVPTGMDLHMDPVYDPLRGDPRFERINRGKQ
jgi:tetratricopeptide (TPR) repeat protein/TolB-like protein